MSESGDRFAIIAVLDRYAECLDTRDWEGLADVFAPDADVDFGVWHAENLHEIKENIRSFLGGCGASQHLLGNYRIDLQGDRASSRCYCHVMHFGRGEHEGKKFETWIEYADELERSKKGWRSHRRISRVMMADGDATLLGPD